MLADGLPQKAIKFGKDYTQDNSKMGSDLKAIVKALTPAGKLYTDNFWYGNNMIV